MVSWEKEFKFKSSRLLKKENGKHAYTHAAHTDAGMHTHTTHKCRHACKQAHAHTKDFLITKTPQKYMLISTFF